MSFFLEQWDRIGLEYELFGMENGIYNLYINDFIMLVVFNLFVNNLGFVNLVNNVFFGIVGGVGEVYIDGLDVFFGFILVPIVVQIVVADVDNEFGV